MPGTPGTYGRYAFGWDTSRRVESRRNGEHREGVKTQIPCEKCAPDARGYEWATFFMDWTPMGEWQAKIIF